MLSKQENILLNDKEYEEGKVVLSSLPINFTIGITRKCNYSCKMCYRHTYPRDFVNVEMSDYLLDKIKPSLVYANICRWHCDGEIFMASNFNKVFTIIKSCEAAYNGFSTNGYFLLDYAEDIVNSNISLLNVSIDAATSKTYTLIRSSESAFNKVCQGISKITSSRQNGKPFIELMFVAMKVNLHELSNFAVLAKTLGADRVVVQRFNPHVVSAEVRDWGVSLKAEAAAFFRAKDIGQKLGLEVIHTHEAELTQLFSIGE